MDLNTLLKIAIVLFVFAFPAYIVYLVIKTAKNADQDTDSDN
ncbi:hypothetical protein [Arenicella chitinivorans]|nr:hypothetical protein [Arenicella chitinivorans]